MGKVAYQKWGATLRVAEELRTKCVGIREERIRTYLSYFRCQLFIRPCSHGARLRNHSKLDRVCCEQGRYFLRVSSGLPLGALIVQGGVLILQFKHPTLFYATSLQAFHRRWKVEISFPMSRVIFLVFVVSASNDVSVNSTPETICNVALHQYPPFFTE